MVDGDGFTEKHRKSQLIKSIYMDALHCDMVQQPPVLLLKTVKNTLSNQHDSRFSAQNPVTTCPCRLRPFSARS